MLRVFVERCGSVPLANFGSSDDLEPMHTGLSQSHKRPYVKYAGSEATLTGGANAKGRTKPCKHGKPGQPHPINGS